MPLADRNDLGNEQCEPAWFGPVERPVFGFFHPPRHPARDCVVVLCNPFGYDAMLTHFAYRHLAERLARAGFAALRFDYFGAGDSGGDDASADRIDEWLESLDAACVEARRRSGASAIALFGLKLGGLLATVAAQRMPVDDLVLLGPSTSGRGAVRELRAQRLLQQPIPGAVEPPSPEDESFGFLMTEPMRAALGKLDPTRSKGALAKRALVILRDDVAGGERPLVDHLRACGVNVTTSTTPGYAMALRDDPYTCQLPEAAWNEIVAWLSAAHASAAPGTEETPGQASVVLGDVREQAVRFDGNFGVLTEPLDPTGARAHTAIVLLDIGANHRIGTNRMYVRWARAWAKLGFRVLRFDFTGIGDSPVRAGRLEKDVYSALGMTETRRAMDLLASRGVDRFVLGGLCSGAYVAYYAALENPRVAGIFLMNLPTFHWKEGDSLELVARSGFQATSVYKRKVFDLKTWRRALRGEVKVRAVTTELVKRTVARVRNAATDRAIRLGLVQEPDDVARAFKGLCARGCQSLLVYGANDGALDVMEKHLGAGAAKLRHDKRLRVEVLDGADHVFTARDAQRRLEEVLTRYLVGAFG
jgi:pimeloyl-ACP methyl ester carboxylesterase